MEQDESKLIITNSCFPSLLYSGWVCGSVYEPVQASNTKLYFARRFLRRIFFYLLEGDDETTTLALPHSVFPGFRYNVWNHHSQLVAMT